MIEFGIGFALHMDRVGYYRMAEATDGSITRVNRLSDRAKILKIRNCRLQ